MEHPKNWNQLNLQEKANLIILDNIIKLACIDDTREDVIKEIQALYAKQKRKSLRRYDIHTLHWVENLAQCKKSLGIIQTKT